jgi:response regulator RpfG family c-di-GMP phosphodiesterase
MSASVAVVLTLTAVATAWLVWYVRVTLPRQMDERIFESIKAFGKAVELRFPSHEGLMTRVVALSNALGSNLGLTPHRLRILEEAARLRDIGLCAIPYRLVNSMHPMDWNVAEKTTYLKHAEVGGAMLELIPELDHLSEIVRYHHSRYDGATDPDEPSGDRLPLESRIIKIVADYVWYERYSGVGEAMRILQEGRGGSYWPSGVDALLSVLTSSRVEQREPSLL